MIKVFIIAALSADGFIAKNAEHAALWTSKADKHRFIELTKRAGVVVMGNTTFKTLGRPLRERLNIVYSKNQTFEGVEMTQKPPLELISDLESRGIKEVAICGGSHIYTMFMKAGVVDTLYLTIEPVLFGKGIGLFNEDLHYLLKLQSSMASESAGSLLLEYKVDYSGTPKLKD
ncbi:MAG: dihydrofolate reductase family protein [Candidatus Taylorbacteria bacterium]|nr:dihydrofolate reductase family protein [Candidatus Taylorbacteria bacterium]